MKKRGLFIAFGYSIDRHGLLNVTYRLENQSFGIGEKINNQENFLVSLLGFTLKYDTEDAFFSKAGSVLDFSIETNIFAINDYTKFTKISTFLKTNFTINNNHTLSPSIFLGVGDNSLPYPEYFSFGGQNNFYGFRDDQEMGRQMFRLSLEYRYELPSVLSALNMKSYLSTRYDYGSV